MNLSPSYTTSPREYAGHPRNVYTQKAAHPQFPVRPPQEAANTRRRADSILPGKEVPMQVATHRTLHVTEDQLEMLTQGIEEAWPTIDRTSEELYELYDKLTGLANEFTLDEEDD